MQALGRCFADASSPSSAGVRISASADDTAASSCGAHVPRRLCASAATQRAAAAAASRPAGVAGK